MSFYCSKCKRRYEIEKIDLAKSISGAHFCPRCKENTLYPNSTIFENDKKKLIVHFIILVLGVFLIFKGVEYIYTNKMIRKTKQKLEVVKRQIQSSKAILVNLGDELLTRRVESLDADVLKGNTIEEDNGKREDLKKTDDIKIVVELQNKIVDLESEQKNLEKVIEELTSKEMFLNSVSTSINGILNKE